MRTAMRRGRSGRPIMAKPSREVLDLAAQIHREHGEPPGYEGPCWGPTQEDVDEAERRLAAAGTVAGNGKPGVYQLWQQAGGENHAEYDRDRFIALMREHGYLLCPGDEGYEDAPRNLPCGWPHRDEVEKGPDFMTDFIPPAGAEPG